MKERVEAVRLRRETAARARDRNLLPTVAIVGYTNAGKSTLLNMLVGDEVVGTENKLFATLDPTSRRVALAGRQSAIVSDTVGFIHKLPHQLVDAFRATLEEVIRADVLLLVVDMADAHRDEHLDTVQAVLDELGAGDKPRLIVGNKMDLVPSDDGRQAPSLAIPGSERGTPERPELVSAVSGAGMGELRARLAELLAELWVEVDATLPYTAGELLARVRERGSVVVEYGDRDVHVQGRVVPSVAGDVERVAGRWRRAVRRAAEREGPESHEGNGEQRAPTEDGGEAR